MKTNVFKTVLFSILLVLLGQCTYDRPQNLIAPRSTAQQLASNADFVELVTITNRFQDVIYNNLRNAHSEKVRDARHNRVSSLLHFQDNKDSLVAAIRLLGFENVDRYLLDLNQMNALKAAMYKGGIDMGKVPTEALTEAYAAVSQQLGHTYPPKPSSARDGEIPTASGNRGFCPECRFNNCDECSISNEETAPDGTNEDGPGYSCRANAEARRANAIAMAQNTLFLTIITCGGTGWAAGEVACGATMITIVGAPISPAVGAGVGCFVFVGCGTFAYVDYELKLRQAELEYQANIAGCPR